MKLLSRVIPFFRSEVLQAYDNRTVSSPRTGSKSIPGVIATRTSSKIAWQKFRLLSVYFETSM